MRLRHLDVTHSAPIIGDGCTRARALDFVDTSTSSVQGKVVVGSHRLPVLSILRAPEDTVLDAREMTLARHDESLVSVDTKRVMATVPAI